MSGKRARQQRQAKGRCPSEMRIEDFLPPDSTDDVGVDTTWRCERYADHSGLHRAKSVAGQTVEPIVWDDRGQTFVGEMPPGFTFPSG